MPDTNKYILDRIHAHVWSGFDTPEDVHQIVDELLEAEGEPDADSSLLHAAVRTEFRKSRGAEPVQVDYRLARTKDGWKIYDVNVMGVWLGLTYQESFASEIRRGGIDGLIHTLEEKNKALQAKAEGGQPEAARLQ